MVKTRHPDKQSQEDYARKCRVNYYPLLFDWIVYVGTHLDLDCRRCRRPNERFVLNHGWLPASACAYYCSNRLLHVRWRIDEFEVRRQRLLLLTLIASPASGSHITASNARGCPWLRPACCFKLSTAAQSSGVVPPGGCWNRVRHEQPVMRYRRRLQRHCH
jgi:hypothetical protein